MPSFTLRPLGDDRSMIRRHFPGVFRDHSKFAHMGKRRCIPAGEWAEEVSHGDFLINVLSNYLRVCLGQWAVACHATQGPRSFEPDPEPSLDAADDIGSEAGVRVAPKRCPPCRRVEGSRNVRHGRMWHHASLGAVAVQCQEVGGVHIPCACRKGFSP